jgi:hypothetical protein
MEVDFSTDYRYGYMNREEEQAERKWLVLRKPLYRLDPNPFKEMDYSVKGSLSERFRETGLQVIVKLVSIELTPDKPVYPAGGWHVSVLPDKRRTVRA